ncbi:MAG: 2-hydroxychromene-2-carboxylate isomerase [Hyphomicrobiales bacterium]|nr:2-hydroxychromene-2-carboxylate isomerase [Hyphomicrobiales bacterium]
MATIDYVYSAHSAFAYLGSKRLLEICAAHGVQLNHKPIFLSPVVEAQNSPPFGARTQAHVDYFFGREIERWAEFRNVPIINFRPTHHDADYGLASGMILALGDSGAAVDAMAHSILEAHWRDDADLSDPNVLGKIATDLGHDAAALLDQAKSEPVQAKIWANSEWAKSQNIFGSPTYILDGDPFYGQDHLELIEHALSQPFAPTRWVNPSVD